MNRKKYHEYVYDFDKNEFKGEFEQMYSNEGSELFDSWHQEDQRHLKRQIDLLLFEMYNLNEVVDFGCGKGSLTHLFKKMNNQVTGFDISSTAIEIAKSRYPDIAFHVHDLNDLSLYSKFSKNNNIALLIEVLSYLSNWREILKRISEHFEYCLINLYLPENTLGYIKSEDEFNDFIKQDFDFLFQIKIESHNQHICFLKAR